MTILRAAVLILFVADVAAAVVVEDTNVDWRTGGGIVGLGNYTGTIFQNVAATNPTSAEFDYTDGFLRLIVVNADEGSNWYPVNQGDVVNPNLVGQDYVDLRSRPFVGSHFY